MALNTALKFKVANHRDFVPLGWLLLLLVLIASALSPQPLILVSLLLVLFGLACLRYKPALSKVTEEQLTLIIYPEGDVRLEFEQGSGSSTEGFLEGQQWRTRHITILRCVMAGKLKHHILRSAHQHADDYRRLGVWIKYRFCSDTEKPIVH
jgi:hypothetical protein